MRDADRGVPCELDEVCEEWAPLGDEELCDPWGECVPCDGSKWDPMRDAGE